MNVFIIPFYQFKTSLFNKIINLINPPPPKKNYHNFFNKEKD